MEMKAKALASVDISGLQTRPWQRPLPSLMMFLKALVVTRAAARTYVAAHAGETGPFPGGATYTGPQHIRNSRTHPGHPRGIPPTATPASCSAGATHDEPRPSPAPAAHPPALRRQREQQSFQLLVIEIVRHRPGNPGSACPAEIAVHRTGTELQARATARWLKPCPNRRRRTSRIFRIDNLSPGIPIPCSQKDRDYLRLKLSAEPTHHRVDHGVHDHRNRCSRSAGFSVHNPPERAPIGRACRTWRRRPPSLWPPRLPSLSSIWSSCWP